MGLAIISQDLGGGIPRNWTFQPEPASARCPLGAGVESSCRGNRLLQISQERLLL